MKKVLLVAAMAGAIAVAFGSLNRTTDEKKQVKTEKKSEHRSPCGKY